MAFLDFYLGKNASILAIPKTPHYEIFLIPSMFSFSQWTLEGAYLIGDFVQIGINHNGHEGAPYLAGSHNRGADTSIFFGYVADPNETTWTEYNGDYFTPGTQENGWGIEFAGIQLYASELLLLALTHFQEV